MNPKLRNSLGLCMRAGKLVTGDEIVLKAIRSGQAKLVIIAADASHNTMKKFTDKCNSYQIPFISFGDRYELGSSIGKGFRVIAAVTDTGFASLIQQAAKKHSEV